MSFLSRSLRLTPSLFKAATLIQPAKNAIVSSQFQPLTRLSARHFGTLRLNAQLPNTSHSIRVRLFDTSRCSNLMKASLKTDLGKIQVRFQLIRNTLIASLRLPWKNLIQTVSCDTESFTLEDVSQLAHVAPLAAEELLDQFEDVALAATIIYSFIAFVFSLLAGVLAFFGMPVALVACLGGIAAMFYAGALYSAMYFVKVRHAVITAKESHVLYQGVYEGAIEAVYKAHEIKKQLKAVGDYDFGHYFIREVQPWKENGVELKVEFPIMYMPMGSENPQAATVLVTACSPNFETAEGTSKNPPTWMMKSVRVSVPDPESPSPRVLVAF
eukprot:TRINITY_DN12764_c0_g1::TRINITY_DN12764_c0_g1_i1::g.28702::m.28702 TRINITY_DN12764_c0_g1::TRINITY_DN12764_c0_g1_i1::g.28702  ORF type:complete len:328 (+),score=70.75 TRINITY_DN12764_c0_g1_i1:45-1028(+)